jgi:hypothetical protein
MNEVIALAPTAAAAFSGAVMAFILKCILDYYNRPIIQIALRQNGGYRKARTVGGYDARYVRLLIHNAGNRVIHNCRGYITSVRKESGATPLFDQETTPLTWANSSRETMDIPAKVGLYLDVCSLHRPNQISELWPSVPPTHNRFEEFFQDNTTYHFKIIIAADNTVPKTRDVVVMFRTDDEELTIQNWDHPE